jgi:hypothetical protein
MVRTLGVTFFFQNHTNNKCYIPEKVAIKAIGEMGPPRDHRTTDGPRVSHANGYSSAHTNYAEDLAKYQAKAYSTHKGHVGSVDVRLVYVLPEAVKHKKLGVRMDCAQIYIAN